MPVIINENLQEWMEEINFEDDKYIVDKLMEPVSETEGIADGCCIS